MVVTSVGIYSIQFFKQNDKYSILEIGVLEARFLYSYKLIQPEVIWDSNRVSQLLYFSESFPSQHTIQVIVEIDI
jgi:hypothetical protein